MYAFILVYNLYINILYIDLTFSYVCVFINIINIHTTHIICKQLILNAINPFAGLIIIKKYCIKYQYL